MPETPLRSEYWREVFQVEKHVFAAIPVAQLKEERTRNLGLRVDLREQQAEIDRLRNRAADADSLEQQLRNIQASKAWRAGLGLARLYHLIVPRPRSE